MEGKKKIGKGGGGGGGMCLFLDLSSFVGNNEGETPILVYARGKSRNARSSIPNHLYSRFPLCNTVVYISYLAPGTYPTTVTPLELEMLRHSMCAAPRLGAPQPPPHTCELYSKSKSRLVFRTPSTMTWTSGRWVFPSTGLPPTLPPTLLPPTSSRLPRLPRLPRLTFEGEVGRGRRSPSPEWVEWARGDAATTTCPRCDVLNDELECEEDGCSEEPELDRTRSRTGTPIGADAVRPSKNAACELVGLLELDCSDRFKEERFGVLSGDVDPIDMRS